MEDHFTYRDGISGQPEETIGRLVFIKFMSGHVNPSMPASDIAWDHSSVDYRPVAYRIDMDPERIAYFKRNSPHSFLLD